MPKRHPPVITPATYTADAVITWIQRTTERLATLMPTSAAAIASMGKNAIAHINQLQRVEVLVEAALSDLDKEVAQIADAFAPTIAPSESPVPTSDASTPKRRRRKTRTRASASSPPPRTAGRKKRLTEERKDALRLRLAEALRAGEAALARECADLQEEYGARQLSPRQLRAYLAALRNKKSGSAFAIRIIAASPPERRAALATLFAVIVHDTTAEQLLAQIPPDVTPDA
ncbi:hypothetical protein HYV74_00835 [Candidatus Uhrbacteria bacterium]|nr:hypothetical protein [Candidatus Uhrbacteria bacterium]